MVKCHLSIRRYLSFLVILVHNFLSEALNLMFLYFLQLEQHAADYLLEASKHQPTPPFASFPLGQRLFIFNLEQRGTVEMLPPYLFMSTSYCSTQTKTLWPPFPLFAVANSFAKKYHSCWC